MLQKKSRTLNTCMSRAKIALWFMKSFHHEIKAMEQQTGIFHNLYVDDNTSNSTNGSKRFDSLTDYDKEKIEQVLFLLHKFCVGDSFYHELTMIVDGLPKSYLVKQKKEQLNDVSEVIPTPGEADGRCPVIFYGFVEITNPRCCE